MENFIAHLKEVIPEKDSLKLVKKEAENYYKQHSLDECFATGLELYQSENFQIQEVGVFLVGNPGKPRNPHETGGSGSWSQPIYNTFTTFAKTGRALICHPTGSKTPYRDSTPHTAFFH